MSGLVGIRRRVRETWLQAARRLAAPHGQEEAVEEKYKFYHDECMVSEEESALAAVRDFGVAQPLDENDE